MAAPSSSSMQKPLLDPESQDVEKKEEQKEAEKTDWQKFTEDPCGFMKDWFCTNPMANLPVLVILFGGIFCIFGGLLVHIRPHLSLS